MEYDLDDISSHSSTRERFADWLADESFIYATPDCPDCDTPMDIQVYNKNKADGVVHRCWTCLKRWSVRRGTVFEGGRHTSMRQQMNLMVSFQAGTTVSAASKEQRLSRTTVSAMYARFRALVVMEVERRADTGDYNFGVGVFEIDCMHARRIRDEEHNLLLPDVIVLGILERATGSLWLERVPDEKGTTLVPIIQAHVPAASVICTDEHGAFRHLNTHGYHHRTVNHTAGDYSHAGVDQNGAPLTITTNALEGRWPELRRRVKNHAHRTLARLDAAMSELMLAADGDQIFDLCKV